MHSVHEPDLALAGVALLVIFGLLIWYDKPVESIRAFDPYAQHQDLQTTGYTYESWLWQDPFGFDSISLKKESEFYSVNQKKEFAFFFTNQKKEREGQCEYQLNKKIKDIKDDKKNGKKKDVKILAPLLKVRSQIIDIENKELRTRDRYAVIAGLVESGYRPQDPDHLHFCSSQENKEYDVRWEHFRYEPKDQLDTDTTGKNKTNQQDKRPDIIVAWMNSEIFTDNAKLEQMSGKLFKAEEISKIKFSVYDLNHILDQKRSIAIKGIIKNKTCKDIDFVESALDDEALIEKLTKELRKLRNIKELSEVMIITEQDSENVPGLAHRFRESLCSSFPKPVNATTDNAACEIKSIFYLKGLDAYQQVLHKQDKNDDQANKSSGRLSAIDLDIPPPLPIGPGQFDYFHRLAKQINDVHTEINLEKRDSGIKAIGIFGSDFYDKLLILEALRAEMPNILVFTTELDAQMLHPPHWLSTRNLVVASHFNLLLKDEDREQYQKQYKDGEIYQKQFPAFRDSQQVNIFFHTISTVTGHVEKQGYLSPQIFEVGRNGFVRLPQEKDEDLKYHLPDKTLEQVNWRLALVASIIIFLIWFHGAFRPDSGKLNSGKLSLPLLISTLGILAIAWFIATDALGELLSFSDGISLWPTIFIQIIAILLAVYFFIRAREELDENFCGLSRQHFRAIAKNFTNCINECGWELSRLGGLSIAPLFVLILTILGYAFNDVDPSESGLPFYYCLVPLVSLTAFYLLIIEEWDSVSIKHWMEKDTCDPRKINKNLFRIYNALRRVHIFSFSKNRLGRRLELCQESYEYGLWREYYNYGLPAHRVSRVVAIWLFFAIIETVLIYLLPPWPLPCRGEAACGWAAWTGVISFIAVMLLLFFILDVVRLNFYWIKKLRTQHPLLADRITGEDENAFWAAITNKPLESLERIVAVVAERTEVVDRLIYYPMLCIMLMLFARITYFDNQDFPPSKAITFAASISLLFFSGFMLRYEASQLKRSVIKSAERLGKNDICTKAKIDTVIKRINGICEGAFEPMFEQPVLRALLIILASIGLFTGEYLKLFE